MVKVTIEVKDTSRRLGGPMDTSARGAVVLDDDEMEDIDRTGLARRLQSATIVISYEITIPQSSSVTVESVESQVSAAQADDTVFLNTLNTQLAAAGIAEGTYTITAVSIGEVTTELPPTGNNATNTTAAPTVKRGVTGGTCGSMAFSIVQQLAVVLIGMLASS